uniref:NADH-ubiquinone oxidoreductase chain 6 n=1 Tax=Panulirus cygnus TaxID=150421 RepID=A0A0M3TGL7_9EUCA|nr:NADH dehydrogenase subunit 6 [Panulirus cygnus]ALE28930.1 NADH dehydrogenase subunit 6 [Panulirus cygnus]
MSWYHYPLCPIYFIFFNCIYSPNSPPIGSDYTPHSNHADFHLIRNNFSIVLIFYILFLIFLGGMLVLFIYVASLASNESFKLSLFLTAMILLGSFSLSALFMFLDPLFSIQPVSVQHSFFSAKDIPDLSSISTHFIYNFPTMGLTLVVILYLLFTLIVVVEMTSVFSGPLRLSK